MPTRLYLLFHTLSARSLPYEVAEVVAETEGSAEAGAAVAETVVADRHPPVVSPRLGASGAPSIQTCQKESGVAVLYIISGGEMLIFVPNPQPAPGGTSSLPSSLNNNETGTSSARNIMTRSVL